MAHQQFYAAEEVSHSRKPRTPKPHKLKRTKKTHRSRWPRHAGWFLFTVAAIVWLWGKHPEPVILATLERWFAFFGSGGRDV